MNVSLLQDSNHAKDNASVQYKDSYYVYCTIIIVSEKSILSGTRCNYINDIIT